MEFKEEVGHIDWGMIGTQIIYKLMMLGGRPGVNVDRGEAGQRTGPWGTPTLRDGKR